MEKKAKRKRDSEKSKKIRDIFGLDLEQKKKEPNHIIINYDKKIYFQKPETYQKDDDINKYITKVLSSTNNQNANNNIQFNVNINNNFFNGTSPESEISARPSRIKESSYHVNNLKEKKREPFHNSIQSGSLAQRNLPSKTMRSQGPIKPKEDLLPKNEMLLYIPCMNCGNSIAVDDIEKHSLTCTKVSKEVLENDSKKSEFYPIHYKLKKLKEHLLGIKNGETIVPASVKKEMEYISTILIQYINDTLKLEEINLANIKELKKILKNLEILPKTNKSLMSSLILIERTKVLVSEKMKLYRNYYRINVNTRKTNEIKSGCLKYEEDLKEKIKQLEKINQETELEKTKVKNLRKSATPSQKPKNLELIINNSSKSPLTNGSRNSKVLTTSSKEGYKSEITESNAGMDEQSEEQPNHKVEEILSDIDNSSQNLSFNTSISNTSTYEKEDQQKINFNYGTFNNDVQREKQKFFNLVLSQKFEKLHSTHKGQKINPKLIFKECQRLKIPEEDWKEFIIKELNNPNKYELMKKKKSLNVNVNPTMGVIDEEK